ncbi:hypothetical protein [Aliarcobacter butzleri]|uniref:hypothetical protein n=1 Tax=Aliarcobacter butzleri TaxID=28197 RepID=UPI0021B45429|nr:hypothetical protein [Aliarcobacter butzleri]MCT7596086.1 hypothetical protein [Aliarcobacter butzleri]
MEANNNKNLTLNSDMESIFNMVNTEDKIKQTVKSKKEDKVTKQAEAKEVKKIGRPIQSETAEKADIKISAYITKSLKEKIEKRFGVYSQKMSFCINILLEEAFKEGK